MCSGFPSDVVVEDYTDRWFQPQPFADITGVVEVEVHAGDLRCTVQALILHVEPRPRPGGGAAGSSDARYSLHTKLMDTVSGDLCVMSA